MERNTLRKYDPAWLEKNECARLRRQFGITLEQKRALSEAQGYTCAICGGRDEERDLAVDHDHVSGKVRGLLCRACNIGLGQFGDNPILLKSAISYLEKNS